MATLNQELASAQVARLAGTKQRRLPSQVTPVEAGQLNLSETPQTDCVGKTPRRIRSSLTLSTLISCCSMASCPAAAAACKAVAPLLSLARTSWPLSNRSWTHLLDPAPKKRQRRRTNTVALRKARDPFRTWEMRPVAAVLTLGGGPHQRCPSFAIRSILPSAPFQ